MALRCLNIPALAPPAVRGGGGGRHRRGLLQYLLCLPTRLPCYLCSRSDMPPLPASLTDLPGRFLRLLERSTESRLQSLLCDYTTDVPLASLHEAIRALGDAAGTAPGHLCDTWRWLALEGELSAVSDLQVMLTNNGVLLSVTADVKTSAGVRIITHCQAAMAQSLPLLAFAQTAGATSRELLLRWNPYFQRIHGNSFRSRPRQLFGLTEADQSPEFKGTQYSKLVTDPISQRLPPQRRSPWAEWHKKDGPGQWAVIIEMPAMSLNTPHVAPDILHQIYPYILWWAADLVATPQQKFPVGSPANVKVRKVPAEQAPRVLEASTLLLRDEEMAGQVMELASPPWAPASVLALHLPQGYGTPCRCVPHKSSSAPPVCRSCLWRCGLRLRTPLPPRISVGSWWMTPSPLLQPVQRPAQRKRFWISWWTVTLCPLTCCRSLWRRSGCN